jgi:hypothetical protein
MARNKKDISVNEQLCLHSFLSSTNELKSKNALVKAALHDLHRLLIMNLPPGNDFLIKNLVDEVVRKYS